ncbi:protein refolding chaperone Spy/CpxP family [Paracoccus thiocyanatus]|uniref:Protein refolding chaperone Spy/CpxP family n=1 Tax=Paracoccus thiocyanatus TaxID=34006 RepID=A0A1N6Y818_9RHOB|nr:Spy/CpxP family protein refolding chaperone [Paracoccus thiocyanatus]SIR10619.1 protein refolding chaperone Spy/CpxP family [Paracoccus thiocyanatus]
MEHVTGRSRRRTYLWGGLAALLILAALATAAAVRADGFRGHGMGGAFRGMMLERALKSVEASDDQRQQIWTILDAARAEIRPMASALDDRRGRLADLMAAPELDRAAVEALRQEVMATADAASLRASQALLDAAEVLTPEQRAALVAKRRDMGREMGRGFGPGQF